MLIDHLRPGIFGATLHTDRRDKERPGQIPFPNKMVTVVVLLLKHTFILAVEIALNGSQSLPEIGKM